MPRKGARSSEKSYVALLRGINLGGHNRVAMADLRALFASLGAADVETYVQSGNVIFKCADGPGELTEAIQKRIRGNLGEGCHYSGRASAAVRCYSWMTRAP